MKISVLSESYFFISVPKQTWIECFESIEKWTFDHCLSGLVDWGDGLGIPEAELVWSYSYDRSVFLMQRKDSLVNAQRQEQRELV